jgi:hypothetical protein
MPVPFPSMAAEAPGMLTEQEVLFGVDDVVQDEPEPTNKECAMLAADTSAGLEIGPFAVERPQRKEIIELLNIDDE